MSPPFEPALRQLLEVEGSDSETDAASSPGSLPLQSARAVVRLLGRAALACSAGAAVLVAAHSVSRPVRSPSLVGAVQMDAVRPTAAFLKPTELMHDGNVCDFKEELFGGLCYKRCGLLTGGEAPIRTSPWTCCRGHPCTPMNERGSIGDRVICAGFDVGGEGSCPHKPGACLLDEELHLGICYKQCGLLTQGVYPHRVAAATCCRTTGLRCLLFRNAQTSNEFDVGGGAGDHDPSTLAGAHPPQQSLTEAAEPEGTSDPVPVGGQEVLPAMVVTPLIDLPPPERMHGGNVCAGNEELFGGLCYKKCGLLTSGEAPFRTSSWTCCESHPCGLANQLGAVGKTILCNGYDVAGDGSCPHRPGTCLADEEPHFGLCYEKCSLLTKGAFPHRIAAATCCKEKGLRCLDLRNDLTRATFDVGGGEGDHHAAASAEAMNRSSVAPAARPGTAP